MRIWALAALVLLSLVFPVTVTADECLEGDCDNGYGTGFTEDNIIYEGAWKHGLPHGQGKLFVSGDKVVAGCWEKGELVEKAAGEQEKETRDE